MGVPIIDMKKKLLITMGCSYTEGVGCWIDETPHGLKAKSSHEEYSYWYELSRDNFHEKGWPNQLGKLMGFDKVINLGMGGASTSSNVKFWFERYSDEYFDNYDVTMVWLLPSPYRISFYKNSVLEDELINEPNSESLSAWLVRSDNSDLDVQLEQASWVRIMINECKLKNIKLVLFAQLYYNHLIKLVNQRIYDSELLRLNRIEEYKSIACGHLNELGYYKLAEVMYMYISRTRPDIKIGEKVDDLEWSWEAEREQIIPKMI